MFHRSPPITRALLLSGVLIFASQELLGELPFLSFMLWPVGDFQGSAHGLLLSVGFRPWQVLTYGFLHGGVQHLFFNMLALYMFGAPLEAHWGSRRFALYYFACVLGAGLVQLLVATWAVQSGDLPYPTVGASGGVFGLLLAFGISFPRVLLVFGPFRMPAWVAVVGYGVLELLLGLTGLQPDVAHFAHLGGMLFGFLLLQYWRDSWPFGPEKR